MRAGARASSGAALIVALALFLALCALSLAACGGTDGQTRTPVNEGDLGDGGTLSWALADPVREVDPLTATTESEQLAARQINEPLIEKLSGPFGDSRRIAGLARNAKSTRNNTVWAFEIRSGVRFQDGARLNASAVLTNAERWRTTPEGQRALGPVSAVDAPRPDLVRFFLPAPDPDFPKRLTDPRLGLVSPHALRPRSGMDATVARVQATGTGAFELRERNLGSALLARNTNWWGTGADLGPALDRVELDYVALPSERARELEQGEVQVASALGRSDAHAAKRNPLLSVLPAAAGDLGVERSVRGIDSADSAPSLASVWLTDISDGG